MLIVHYQIKGKSGAMLVTDKGRFDLWGTDKEFYATGIDKPRYPMPAIHNPLATPLFVYLNNGYAYDYEYDYEYYEYDYEYE